MFKMGLEGGKPAKGKAGVQPEWFYKGDGRWLIGPGDTLERPAYALDGGEEPEVAGIYMIDDKGKPWRLGYALGNEYSDHVMERQNYLYLAHSKLRQSAIGPELRLGPLPAHVDGMSRIYRKGEMIWEKPFLTGEANMSHTLANLEFHHFKYEPFRQPGRCPCPLLRHRHALRSPMASRPRMAMNSKSMFRSSASPCATVSRSLPSATSRPE